ncbi:hypothetical protein [Shewanella colwelliana]|uniref:hypothetical protein n=1 Tax=Shewanella colwelliana TaxID=23 RepID=UPI0004900EE2|nr:hypothetical protein [Shewanella colwelliana]
MLPTHGKINCQDCFPSGAEWGKTSLQQDNWLIDNNPCSWGGQNPEVLVLGFSKGTNQNSKLQSSDFNSIPYSGFRHRLSKVLDRLNLLNSGEVVDTLIHGEDNSRFHFASLVRCSLSVKDEHSGKYLKSGNIIARSARDSNSQSAIDKCTRKFLGAIPKKTKVVVLLSNDDGYVDACYEQFRNLYPGLKRINPVAYADQERTWVHVIHPAGTTGHHFNDWLDMAVGKQAHKRDWALEALNMTTATMAHGAPAISFDSHVKDEIKEPMLKASRREVHKPECQSYCPNEEAQGRSIVFPVTLSTGALKNSYIPLSSILHLLPNEIIGGSKKS